MTIKVFDHGEFEFHIYSFLAIKLTGSKQFKIVNVVFGT